MKYLEGYGEFNWSNDKDLINDIINIARDEGITVDLANEKGDIQVKLYNDGQEHYKNVSIDVVTRLQNLPHDTIIKLYRDRKGILNKFRTRELIIENPQDIAKYNILEIEVEIEHNFKKELHKTFDAILDDTISNNFSKKRC